MYKLKIALLGLLAAVALSATASPPAFAHEFLVKGKALAANETKEIVAVGGIEWYFETPVAGNTILLTCDDGYSAPGRSWIGPSGTSKGKGEQQNCYTYIYKEGKTEALSECKLNEPLEYEGTGTLTGVGEGLATGSKGAEELFATLVFPKNEKCSISKTLAVELKVKGKQLCTAPLAAQEAVVHEVICAPGGSSLRSGAENLKVWSTALVMLKSGEPYSST